MKPGEEKGEKLVRTVCHTNVAQGCSLLAHVRDGVITKIEPGDFPNPKYRHICARGLATRELAYHPDRLKYPMKRLGERGQGKWQRISWDEALDTIAMKLKDISARYGSRSLMWAMAGSGCLDQAYFKFARCCEGTFASLIGFGDAAGPCGDRASFGVDWGERYLTDLEKPDLCVFWGNNPAETQIFGIRMLMDAKERGAKVVVIDPRFTATAAKADEYIPIRPGTDAALALGMINVIIEQGLYDSSFVSNHTVGPLLVNSQTGLFLREGGVISGGSKDNYLVWDTVTQEAQLHNTPGVMPALTGVYTIGGIECRPAFDLLTDKAREYTPEKVAEITEVPSDTISRLALDYCRRRPVASFRGMGLQRTFHGDLSFRAITALAAITGNVHLKGLQPPVLNRKAFLQAGGRCAIMPLLKIYDAIAKEDPYPIKALWLAKHNMLNQIASAKLIREGLLPRLEFIVVVELFMNASAQYADILLPASSFLEQTDLMTPPIGNPGVHNYMQLKQKVIEPLHESKPDLEILAELAQKMGFGEYFDKSAEEYIELLLSSGHPSVEGITLQKLREGPVEVNPYPVPTFSTPSGRIEFYSEKLLEMGQELPCYLEPLESRRRPLAQKYPLSYFSTHSRYRSHSVFANVSWLRELETEPVLEISPADAEARDIEDGDLVCAFNDRGKVKLKAKVQQGIRPGVVNVTQGWWPQHYAEGSHQDLTHAIVNPAQEVVYEPNTAFYDVLVEVEKVRER